MKLDVDLIVVTHNSGSILEAFLCGIPDNVNIIVADNASTDNSAAIAKAAGAQLVDIGDNVGYGSACNIGAAAGNASLLLFVNPDVRFEIGAIEALVAASAAYPDAAFNPRIYSGTRRRFRRRSRLLADSESWHGAAPDRDCTIPVLHGSCVFIRRSHFERVGGFDSNIFLFHEDDDLSVRLRQAGVGLRLAAGALIDHAEGSSSARSSRSGRLKGEAMGQSLVYVMKKHGLPFDLKAERRRTWAKLLLPHVLMNNARRAKLLGFLRGLNGEPVDRQGRHA